MDLADSLTSIAVAQLLHNIGIDRIHGAAHALLVQVAQEYLTLLAKKASRRAEEAGRCGVSLLDVDLITTSSISLNEYLQEINSIMIFPRAVPEQLIIKSKRETPLGFPELPTVQDEIDASMLVPDWESKNVELEERMRETSDDLYYSTKTVGNPNEFLILRNKNDYQSMLVDSVADTVPDVDMDTLLLKAMENSTLQESYGALKKHPLIAHEELLTLLTFRTNNGVAIPEDGSSGYESKSIIGDLLLLRVPGMHKLFGGERELEPGGKLASELYNMPRTRKKEKARDSGQGKAPVKTAEQKAERRERMEKAAAAKRKLLAEADIRREVKLLAKLEKTEKKGIVLDPATLQKKEELKERVGGIMLVKKESKREKMKKEELRAQGIQVDDHEPILIPTEDTNGQLPRFIPASNAASVLFEQLSQVVKPVKNKKDVINCVCANNSLNDGSAMICCESCNVWFHTACVDVDQQDFTCSRCNLP